MKVDLADGELRPRGKDVPLLLELKGSEAERGLIHHLVDDRRGRLDTRESALRKGK